MHLDNRNVWRVNIFKAINKISDAMTYTCCHMLYALWSIIWILRHTPWQRFFSLYRHDIGSIYTLLHPHFKVKNSKEKVVKNPCFMDWEIKNIDKIHVSWCQNPKKIFFQNSKTFSGLKNFGKYVLKYWMIVIQKLLSMISFAQGSLLYNTWPWSLLLQSSWHQWSLM